MWDFAGKVFSEYGLIAVVLIALGAGTYKIIDKIFRASDKREDRLMNMLENYMAIIKELNEQTKQFHSELKTANDYQRKEHCDLQDKLERINEKINRN